MLLAAVSERIVHSSLRKIDVRLAIGDASGNFLVSRVVKPRGRRCLAPHARPRGATPCEDVEEEVEVVEVEKVEEDVEEGVGEVVEMEKVEEDVEEVV